MSWVRAPQSAIRLKVTLKDLKPPVWRRLLVEDTMTLGDLHMAVQAAMGWDNGHLHLFMVDREQIGDPRQLDEVEDEARVKVGDLAAAGWKSFAYIYDMGDSWEHTIKIEGSEALILPAPIPPASAASAPARRRTSGGPWGFADMLAAVADPKDDRHAEFKEWLGEFDPEAFSVEAAEARVRVWFAPKRTRKPRGKS